MIALIALLLSMLLGALSKVFAISMGLQITRMLLILLILILSVVTLVLGILGLSEYSKEKGRYMQGRTQAGWALVISCVMMTLVFAGLMRGFIRQAAASNISTVSSKPGKVITKNDLNFSFRSPERPWAQVDLSKLNKFSKLSFMRRSPEAYFMIIAENLGGDTKLDTEQLVEVAKVNMEAASSSMRLIQKTPYRINNLDGVLVQREAKLSNYDFFYTQWYLVTNGYSYQLVSYCRSSDKSQLESQMLGMFSGFNLVDPNRMAGLNKLRFETNYISPAHFFTVNVAHSDWHAYVNLKKNMPEAEFGASRGDSCFIVVPVWLGKQKVDKEALASGLLATMNIKLTDDALTHRQSYENNGIEGLQFDYQRTINGSLYRYRLRTIRQGEFGYFLASWTMRNNGVDEILNDGLDRIKINPPAWGSLKSPLQFDDQSQKTQAEVNNYIGLFFYHADEFEKALPFFKKAAGAGDNATYVNNVLLILAQMNRSKEGLDYLNGMSTELLVKPDIRLYQAYFQSKCSLTANAITNYADVFSKGYRSDSDFVDYIELLIATRDYERALNEVKRYLAAGDSTSVRLEIGQIYRAMPDFEKAVAFLKEEHQKAPYNATIARRLIRTLLDADKPNEALEYSKELLNNDSQTFAGYYLKGQCELTLKWYREAKTSLEAAAKLQPSDQDVQSDLNYVNGLLGEGNNSMLKTPIDLVPLPITLTNLALAHTLTNYSKSYGCYYEYSIKAISYTNNVEYRVTDYLAIRVLDAAGVAAFSTFQMPFDPFSEEIYVNDARVYDSSGKLLSVTDPSDCYVIDNSYKKSPSNDKLLNLPLSGLQPGSTIILAITRRSTGKLDKFPFLCQVLSKYYPVNLSGVYLQNGVDGLIVRSSSGINRESLGSGVFLAATNPMMAKWEPLQVPLASFLPAIWIADNSWSWTRLATNYLAQINDKLQCDEGMRIKAKQLTAGASNDLAEVTALSRFVQTNFVYKAIEFGRHTQVPNSATETFKKAYGDCKDLSVLLQQMLQSVGINANLALVSSDTPVLEDIPSLDQFDHMIVACKMKEGEKFVDCTAKGANLADFIPVGLAGHSAFVLDGVDSHFTKLPNYPTNYTQLQIRQLARIINTGDLVVDETVRLTGTYGAYLRSYFQDIPLGLRQESLQRDMDLSDVVITNLEVNALDNPTLPLEVKYSFLLKNQFHPTPNGMAGMLRSGMERYYLIPTMVEHRHNPFEFTVPIELDSQIRFVLPNGAKITGDANPIINVNSRFFTFESRQTQEHGQLNVTFHYLRPIGKFSAEDYSMYQENQSEILSFMNPALSLRNQ